MSEAEEEERQQARLERRLDWTVREVFLGCLPVGCLSFSAFIFLPLPLLLLLN